MRDLVDEFNGFQLQANFREATRRSDGWALIDETRKDQLSPEYAAELRDYLQEHAYEPDAEFYQLQHEPISITTPVGARLAVYENDAGIPSGEIMLYDGNFRLRFARYNFAVDKCYAASSRRWREWLYQKYGQTYRRLEECSGKGDWNVERCISPLYHPTDRFGETQAVVKNAAVILIWRVTSITAHFVLDQTIHKTKLRLLDNETSYYGSFK